MWLLARNLSFNSSCFQLSDAFKSQMICVVLTVIMMRRASIMPSITYKLLVSPPAHRGPRMVARPPTERLTPWLNPVVSVTKKPCISVSLHYICWAAICWSNMLNCEAVKKSQPCVFSAVTLEKSDTWDTATKGSPSSWRKTPMMKAVSSHSYPPDREMYRAITWLQ